MKSFKSVLILEDDETFSKLLKKLLEMNFPNIEKISQATRLQEAVSLAEVNEYDCALIDIGIPDGRGFDLIEKLRSHNSDIYCVMITGYTDYESIFKSLGSGAHGYLVKEESMNLIIERLKGIIDGQKPLSVEVCRKVLEFFGQSYKPSAETNLTGREKEILVLLSKGCSSKEIGAMLSISHYTVSDHIKSIYQKLEVGNRAEMTREAISLGLV